MNSKNRLLSVILLLLLLITAASFLLLPTAAAETDDSEIVPCSVVCYVISDDPAGVIVRSGPGDGYPVIGTLSTDPWMVVSTTITGCAGEWLRIKDIWLGTRGEIHPYYPDSNPSKLIGWVHGPALGVQTEAQEGEDDSGYRPANPIYEEPAAGSPVLTRIMDYVDAPIIGCRGEWLKVRYRGVEGWLAPINQAEPGSEGNPY